MKGIEFWEGIRATLRTSAAGSVGGTSDEFIYAVSAMGRLPKPLFARLARVWVEAYLTPADLAEDGFATEMLVAVDLTREISPDDAGRVREIVAVMVALAPRARASVARGIVSDWQDIIEMSTAS